MIKNPKIPIISDEQLNSTVTELLEIIHLQKEIIQQLKDEIAILKGRKPKPDIKPSKLNEPQSENSEDSDDDGNQKKRPGSAKRKKTADLEIHDTKIVKPDHIPEGSRFKGYDDYIVQDIRIETHNIQYRIERWLTPGGDYIKGRLPSEISSTHFGPTLISYILQQYYQAHVTQPLIPEELRDLGTDISPGQLNRIVTEGKEDFHKEKKDILLAGLGVSDYINVDDTAARHKGKNGYCTHIGNELFAFFESTDSKSRINFLTLLSAGNAAYQITPDAIEYMVQQKLPKVPSGKISELLCTKFENKKDFEICLERLGINDARHIRIITEGCLFGNIIENGFNRNMIIMSDDAGQFNVFLHTLCWVHTDRIINKLTGFSDDQRQALDDKRSEIWELYADLKKYKLSPDKKNKVRLENRFDDIFKGDTCFATLNQALKRIQRNKPELLLVLEYPYIPLHNNLSENDIREYVKKRKISGGTRSDEGRKCRDTFTSLKKTCRKLGISFWEFLKARVLSNNEVPYLPNLITSKVQSENL